MTEEKSQSNKPTGPRVSSKKNIADQYVGFSIGVGEIKNLPSNYEDSDLILYSLKVGDLILMDKDGKDTKSGDTLDFKDIVNFLNQNTSTVIKQLRINDLSRKDLDSLLKSENKGKQRKKIIDFIKSLEKVI